MAVPESKPRKATVAPAAASAELSPAEIDYWSKKREALLVELKALERNFLPHLDRPVWKILEEEKKRRDEGR